MKLLLVAIAKPMLALAGTAAWSYSAPIHIAPPEPAPVELKAQVQRHREDPPEVEDLPVAPAKPEPAPEEP